MDFEPVIYRNEGAVLHIILNRPDKRNALTEEMWEELNRTFHRLREDTEIRVILLYSSGGRAFAGGSDIGELHERDYRKALRGKASDTLRLLESLPQPSICVIDGYALGGGCELAMACDIRIAAESARLGQPELGLGLLPGAGGHQRLIRLTGLAKAKELIFTGDILTAEEACRIGLVNCVEKTREAALERAGKMAEKMLRQGPLALQLAKMTLNSMENTSFETAQVLEKLAETVAFASEDRREGTAAFIERRQPDFTGR